MQELQQFRLEDYPNEVFRDRNQTITVCVPAKNCAETIGRVVASPLAAQREGLVDQVLVVAADPDTYDAAAVAGAEVVTDAMVFDGSGFEPGGKGGAVWAAARGPKPRIRGQVVVLADGDSGPGTSPTFFNNYWRLAGPLVTGRADLVKGAFRRPFKTAAGEILRGEGGRVTELTARPLLQVHALPVPRQPLAGEFAMRGELLRGVLPRGYGLEMWTFLDAFGRYGADRLGEMFIGERQNRHQPLARLNRMAVEVMEAFFAMVLDEYHPESSSPMLPASEDSVGGS